MSRVTEVGMEEGTGDGGTSRVADRMSVGCLRTQVPRATQLDGVRWSTQ